MITSTLHIYVQPGAKRTGVAGRHGDRLKVRIKASALAGQANQAVIHFFADLLKIRKQDIVIVRGLRSRLKTLLITLDQDTLHQQLGSVVL